MAKITIAGDAVVVTSAMKLEDLKTINKYRPNELILKDEESGEPIFAIGITNGGGSINEVGASFGRETHDEEKLATITMCSVEGVTGNIKEWVADRIGGAIVKLNKIEAKLPAVLAEIAAEKEAVMENITVAQ